MFRDRDHAAGILAGRLQNYAGSEKAVIAIPRGGAAIGYELARLLALPLELVLTQKIGHPYNQEYPIGMVSLFGAVFNEDFGVDENYLRRETESARNTLLEKYCHYLPGRAPMDFKGRTVILTDDGLGIRRYNAAGYRNADQRQSFGDHRSRPRRFRKRREENQFVCECNDLLSHHPGQFLFHQPGV
jgi:predicted phosphoribosyltransferase